jgi:FtsH-binding integral membrane protein
VPETLSTPETSYTGPAIERPQHVEAAPAELEQVEHDLDKFMVHVFGWITGALLLSAFFASYADRFEADLPSFVTSNLAFGLIGGMLVMAFVISRKAGNMIPSVAMATLAAYAALQGMLFGFVYRMVYGVSLAPVYLISALVVGALAVYGLRSGTDLTSTRDLLIGGLTVVLVTLLAMIEFGFPTISGCAACAGCWLMLSLVGYHRDLLRDLPASFENDPKWEKAAAVGALQVYLDFVIIVAVVIQARWVRSEVDEYRKHLHKDLEL